MIREVIVVEGKNDTKNLQRYFEVDTIETHGLGLSRETLEYIDEVNDRRGVILFLDPDSAGEKIRKRINDYIPGLKNAFVLKEDARTKKKVGVEHASFKVLKEALDNVVSYDEFHHTISVEDMYELHLMGSDDSFYRRDVVSKKFHIGKCNGKTMLKRLNMLGISREELDDIEY